MSAVKKTPDPKEVARVKAIQTYYAAVKYGNLLQPFPYSVVSFPWEQLVNAMAKKSKG